MFKTLSLCAAGLLLTANASLAGSIGQAERKDFQVAKDIAKTVQRYTQFTIFDDVSAPVKDGVVTLTGKVTMPYKRGEMTSSLLVSCRPSANGSMYACAVHSRAQRSRSAANPAAV